MAAQSSTSSNASGNSRNYAPLDNRERTVITHVPGRCIHPSKLVNMLKTRFGDNYTLEMRDDNYKISARSKITRAEIEQCY
ncbi:hypothetical protein F4803DRAFT_542716 [Xylaria telfairii]|nr:hypothetical protein F4803DRAFT_542716 [Xylaria telfairii]